MVLWKHQRYSILNILSGSANLQRESRLEFASLSTFLSYMRYGQVLIRIGKAPAMPSDVCMYVTQSVTVLAT